MAEPAPVGVVRANPGQDLNLLAGQLYFGGHAAALRTLLGSCVAVALWHPQRRLGGMCHFLLPRRERQATDPLDGRYGDEAMALLHRAVTNAGTRPAEYEAHLYGGADTLRTAGGVKFNIGERNIEQGWNLLDHYGYTLQAVDVGDFVPRKLRLSLEDGQVDLHRGEP